MGENYTILWTNTETGETSFPIKPAPISKESAESWAQGFGNFTGEVIHWTDYLSQKCLNLSQKPVQERIFETKL
jgi:hypothetical protein